MFSNNYKAEKLLKINNTKPNLKNKKLSNYCFIYFELSDANCKITVTFGETVENLQANNLIESFLWFMPEKMLET